MLQDLIPYVQVIGKFLRLYLTPAFLMLQAALMLVLLPFRLFLAGFRKLDEALNISGMLQTFIDALQDLYDMLHLPGSPMLYQMFDFIAGAVGRMASAFINPISMVSSLTESFGGMFGALHSGDATKSFDIAAMANLDTSKIADGIGSIKSAVMELSNIKMDGFLALRTDGASTSMVMGSEGLIKNMTEGKLTVDVKMPEMKMPDIHVKVYIGDKELRDIIRQETRDSWVML